ncbi:hypothetical protein MRX96_056761 [Rhipicephalus microplus]
MSFRVFTVVAACSSGNRQAHTHTLDFVCVAIVRIVAEDCVCAANTACVAVPAGSSHRFPSQRARSRLLASIRRRALPCSFYGADLSGAAGRHVGQSLAAAGAARSVGWAMGCRFMHLGRWPPRLNSSARIVNCSRKKQTK